MEYLVGFLVLVGASVVGCYVCRNPGERLLSGVLLCVNAIALVSFLGHIYYSTVPPVYARGIFTPGDIRLSSLWCPRYRGRF